MFGYSSTKNIFHEFFSAHSETNVLSALHALLHFLLVSLCLLSVGCSATSRLIFSGNSTEDGERDVNQHLRLAFGSCIKNPNSPIWESISRFKPDAFLMLGDNIYQGQADFRQEERIANLYENLRNAPHFKQLVNSTSLLAIWDDHDFGPDNSDSNFQDSSASLRQFRRMFSNNPQPPSELASSVAFDTTIGFIRLVGLDDRTFRRNIQSNENPQMFGDTQISWVESILRSPSTPIVILLSGTQWLSTAFPGKPKVFETFSQYPEEQKRIIEAIKTSPAQVILLSGDRHFSEILEAKLGEKQVYEFTSSPFSANVAPSVTTGNERLRKAVVVGYKNFGLLDVFRESLNVRVQFISETGEPLVSLPLSLLPKAN